MPITEQMQELLQAGQIKEAEPLLRAYVAQHENDRDVRITWVRVLLGLRQLDEAKELVEGLVEAAPNDPDSLSVRALEHELHGRLDDAKTDYEASLALDGEQSNVLYNLGRLLVTSVEFDEAVAEKAETYLKKAIKLTPDHFQASHQLAALYTRLGKLEEAVEACVNTIERNPMHIPSYLFLGEVFSQMGQNSEVIELFKAGLRVNPLAHAFRDELIRLYQTEERYEAAFESAMEQADMRGACEDFLKVGELSMIMGQSQAAEVAYIKAEDVSPKDWRPSYNLGELYRGLALAEQAKEAYERSLGLAETAESSNGLGLLAQAQEGGEEEAIQRFQAALAIVPDSPVYLNNLAYALDQAGRKEDIAETLQRVEPLFPQDDPTIAQVKSLLA